MLLCPSANALERLANGLAAQEVDMVQPWQKDPLGVERQEPAEDSKSAVERLVKPDYRLLRNGEMIERGDQVLLDDCQTWVELAGWEIGAYYNRTVYVPIRRRV